MGQRDLKKLLQKSFSSLLKLLKNHNKILKLFKTWLSSVYVVVASLFDF